MEIKPHQLPIPQSELGSGQQIHSFNESLFGLNGKTVIEKIQPKISYQIGESSANGQKFTPVHPSALSPL